MGLEGVLTSPITRMIFVAPKDGMEEFCCDKIDGPLI